MPRWMSYAAEAAPVAIVAAFLFLIAANPQVSQLKPKTPFDRATDEHFEHDGLTLCNLPLMLERMSATKLHKAPDHVSAPVLPDSLVPSTTRVHFRTTVELDNFKINNFHEKDLPAQIDILREGYFSMMVSYELVDE